VFLGKKKTYGRGIEEKTSRNNEDGGVARLENQREAAPLYEGKNPFNIGEKKVGEQRKKKKEKPRTKGQTKKKTPGPSRKKKTGHKNG